VTKLSGVLAFDLGAGSGRALIGRFDGQKLTATEIHRFSNDPVQLHHRLHWDILRIYYEIKQAIMKSRQQGYSELKGMAIDSWAVDFGLIGRNGELLGNPYHYRDHHTDGVMDQVFQVIPRETVFSRTGIQFLPFNTIYQLYALKKASSPLLENAESLLMIPDLLRYFMTGEKASEFTNATTTQLFNPLQLQWDETLLKQLDLPPSLFMKVLKPGTIMGTLLPSVCEELNVPAVPVIAVGEHDTASAVASIPTDSADFAYLICGTWSLMGTEVNEPVLSDQASNWNFTNEGGIGHTFRLLKNIMGLWILQECKRVWEKEGIHASYEEMLSKARQAKPFKSLIDPDHPLFLNPAHMPNQIKQYCRDTAQPVPGEIGEFVRCIMESLALKYRLILERTEQLSSKRFPLLHMVGGGINNTMLCQFTASAIGKPVRVGPTEASAIGNILVQYIALGQIGSLQEARNIVKQSFDMHIYEPVETSAWDAAFGEFREMITY
jgi:rhamnulokinase